MVNNNKTVSKFWSIFFALIALCAIAVAVFMYVDMSAQLSRQQATTITDDNIYKITLENNLSDNLYSSIDNLSAIDTHLAKLAVTKDHAMQHQLLHDIAMNASNLSVSMAHLPIVDEDNKYTIEQYVNGLYAVADNLGSYVAEGGELTEEHATLLAELRVIAQTLHTALNSMTLEGDMLPITNSLRSDGSNIINDTLVGMDSHMLEDGCEQLDIFSNHCTNCIELGETISEDQAKAIAIDTVSNYHGIEVDSMDIINADNSDTPFYYLSSTTEQHTAYVILTKDGRVAQVDTSSVWVGQGTDNTALVAEQYCNRLGYDVTAIGMPRVEGGIEYITLCPVIEGVTIYPDMVKVAVHSESGAVVAFDGMMYLANHTDRQLVWGNLSLDDATSGIYEGATMYANNRALVMCEGQEHCCHELCLGMGDDMYLLHVDSSTGEHVHLTHLNSTSAVIDR